MHCAVLHLGYRWSKGVSVPVMQGRARLTFFLAVAAGCRSPAAQRKLSMSRRNQIVQREYMQALDALMRSKDAEAQAEKVREQFASMRKDMNLTQVALAQMLDVDPDWVRRREQGHVTVRRVDMLAMQKARDDIRRLRGSGQ